MKRVFLFLASLAMFAFATTPAASQTIYAHGGAGFPSSSAFNNAYNTGYNLGLGIGYPMTSNVEGVIRGSYDRFTTDLSSGRTFSSYSASANLKLNAPMRNNRITPYALGGAGLFRLGVKEAFENELGLQFGAGVSLRTSPRVDLMIEPNYVVILNENENTQYFPVRLGGTFTL